MVISQLLVNKFEWNKVHFVSHLIAFEMNTNLNSDYISFHPVEGSYKMWKGCLETFGFFADIDNASGIPFDPSPK